MIGRFISADTEGVDYNDPQTLNRYTYCKNNPLIFTDPTGHFNWGWGDLWNMCKGFGDSFVSLWNTGNYVLSHPIDTYKALNTAVGHPMDTLNSIIDNYQNLMQTPRGQGQICGQVAQALFTVGVGSAISSAGKATEFTGTLTQAEKTAVRIENMISKIPEKPQIWKNTSILTDGTTQTFLKGNAQNIFDNLTTGATQLKSGAYSINNNIFLFQYKSTTSGVSTISINIGGAIYKIRITQ